VGRATPGADLDNDKSSRLVSSGTPAADARRHTAELGNTTAPAAPWLNMIVRLPPLEVTPSRHVLRDRSSCDGCAPRSWTAVSPRFRPAGTTLVSSGIFDLVRAAPDPAAKPDDVGPERLRLRSTRSIFDNDRRPDRIDSLMVVFDRRSRRRAPRIRELPWVGRRDRRGDRLDAPDDNRVVLQSAAAMRPSEAITVKESEPRRRRRMPVRRRWASRMALELVVVPDPVGSPRGPLALPGEDDPVARRSRAP
jgi:hypothetical protein